MRVFIWILLALFTQGLIISGNLSNEAKVISITDDNFFSQTFDDSFVIEEIIPLERPPSIQNVMCFTKAVVYIALFTVLSFWLTRADYISLTEMATLFGLLMLPSILWTFTKLLESLK